MLGRFHPLLVHLPIGILLLSFALECLARWRGTRELRPAIRLSLAAGALSALASAGTGWLLAGQGGYEADLLQRHQWLGFGAAALALLAWAGQHQRWYFPAFAAAVAVLAAAGHFGGSLTHGAGFLFEKNDASHETATPRADPETAVFAAYVQPLLEKKCTGCHNAAKFKGQLRLDTPEGLRAGGKHGPALDAARPGGSLLLQRLHLPLHHDDHMPPSGKPQLSAAEIQLLEWWVTHGADFQVKIKDLPLPAELENAFAKNPDAEQNPVYALEVPGASERALRRLKEHFVSVRSLGEGKPWLAVSFAGMPEPGPEHWQLLKKIAPQTLDLDLSHVAAPEPALNGMTHLVRLNLAHSGATDGIGPALQKMPYLESLNLTGTSVSDALLKNLGDLTRLKRLYLWQTRISPQGIEGLRRQHPDLAVESGAAVDTARLALRAPRVLFGKTFFSDTVHVSLDYPSFKGVSLYYTLDEAASPTTQSATYREKIVLRETAHLRAFAAKDGWLPSPVVEALLVKKHHTPTLASVAKAPSPKYPAKGAPSLIDGAIADVQGADTWLGYEGEHLSTTLDLGKALPLRQVFVHCLENNVSWIFKPTAIEVETSADGKRFEPRGSARFAANTSMGEQKTHLLGCPLEAPVEARFVRVSVKSLLKNPAWHPGKGQKCWIFVDEVMVE